jgi:hypothetical protein
MQSSKTAKVQQKIQRIKRKTKSGYSKLQTRAPRAAELLMATVAAMPYYDK